jgi:carbamoyltransferase
MQILGLSVFCDASAAIISDNRITCAVEEERINRIKHYEGFPWLAISECLNIVNMKLHEIDIIAVGWNPYRGWLNRVSCSLQAFANSPRSFVVKVRRGSGYINRCGELLSLKRLLSMRFAEKVIPRIIFQDHHLSHAASAFFLCPWEEANVVVADGVGESATVSFFTCRQNQVSRTKRILVPHSLGHVYAAVSRFLGFRICYDEGKVMALASFGKDTYADLFNDIVKFNQATGNVRVDTAFLDYHMARHGLFPAKWKRLTAIAPRKEGEPLTQKHKDLACSLQQCIERTVIKLLKANIPASKKPLCAAGGLFLNAAMNGRILRDINERYFVQPAAGDSGVSIGSALAVASQKIQGYRKLRLQEIGLGRNFTQGQIEKCLKANTNRYHLSNDICAETSGYIARGLVVGWYQGRMEFGPRALGNRSILANPLLSEMKEVVNLKVKHREYFRPFAGSVILEEGHKYFKDYHESPFMLKVFRFRKSFGNTFPAITHIDGTCRIQTVSSTNRPLYTLLQGVKQRTGYGMVLNTSLNTKDQPIVNTPQEALTLFNTTALDVLVMGNFVVKRI